MPVFQSLSEKNVYSCTVYNLTESVDFFLERMNFSREESAELNAISHPSKQLGSVATRYALHLATGSTHRLSIQKDAFGKPFLQDDQRYISLSHTDGFVAAMVSPFPCGIDIQRFDPRLTRLAGRFLSEKEMSSAADHDLEFLTICWSIKEAAYKAYGKKKLEFREDISILDLNFIKDTWESRVQVLKAHEHHTYKVKGWTQKSFVLAICLEL